MPVSRKRHLLTVTFLSVIALVLAVFAVLSFFDIGVFKFEHAPKLDEDPIKDSYEAPPSQFLEEEEVVLLEPTEVTEEEIILPIKKLLFEYVEVTGGCGAHFEGDCLNVRSGPGLDFPVVAQLRNGIVLKVGGKVDHDGLTWYKVVFDEWLRYPERVKDDWYIAAPFAEILLDEGSKTVWEDGSTTTNKRIVVNRTKQTLTAYVGDEVFMETKISTGLELTPTPRGEFTVFKKTPSRYMQGPIPGVAEQYYDMPGVPWNLYFTHGGAVIHGAYWHNSFGSTYSHGCVNLPPSEARELYNWAELGTKVIVTD